MNLLDSSYWQGDTVEVILAVDMNTDSGQARVVKMFPYESSRSFPSTAAETEAIKLNVTAVKVEHRVGIWLNFYADLIQLPEIGDVVAFERDVAFPSDTLDPEGLGHGRIREELEKVQLAIDEQGENQEILRKFKKLEKESHALAAAQRYGRPPLSPLNRRGQPLPPTEERTRERAPLDEPDLDRGLGR